VNVHGLSTFFPHYTTRIALRKVWKRFTRRIKNPNDQFQNGCTIWFSVGDFLGTLELVHDVIAALKDSTGSAASFKDLMRELCSLERALIQVKTLDIPIRREKQLGAIRHAATQCHVTIDKFLQNNKKYGPTLGNNSPAHK
jgi:hypothetical protein